MSGGAVDMVDSLSLLSLKVAPNVFDLSSGLHHISIRDQIVRAQLLVRDLMRADNTLQSLLIVGAGVAGIAAALEAVERSVREIVVLEHADQPFKLFRGVTSRHVGPWLYEWPQVFARNQSYPDHADTPWSFTRGARLHWTSSRPMPADDLAQALEQHLDAQLNGLRTRGGPMLSIRVAVDRHWVSANVKAFAAREAARLAQRLQSKPSDPPYDITHLRGSVWGNSSSTPTSLQPQYVLLAGGMGQEDVDLIKTDANGQPFPVPPFTGGRFWGNDSLREPATADKRVGIFGGGDGALQDLLRALTNFDHPLDFIDHLERQRRVRSALRAVEPDLLALDRQARQYGGWTVRPGIHQAIDAYCGQIAGNLATSPDMRRAVQAGIRDGRGSVVLFVREDHFDKSYLLNRFLCHLLRACRQHDPAGFGPGKMGLDIHFQHQAVGCQGSGPYTVEVKNLATAGVRSETFDHLVVRFGIAPGSVPGAQMIQVSQVASKQRTTLARVEPPVVSGDD